MNGNITFIIIQIVSIAILLFECIYVVMQKPSKLQKILLVIGITSLISSVAYLLELSATNVESAMFGCVMGYVSKPFSLLATFVFLLEYSNVKYKRSIIVGIFVFFVFISTMVFTNQWHHLYYTTVDFDINRPGSGLILGHGIFWYVYMICTILIFVAYVFCIFIEYRKSVTRQAKQMVVLLFLMMFFGIAGLICFITGATGGYDATLAGTLLGSLCLLILLTKYRLFDTLTLAKEKVLSEDSTGIVLIDARTKICYYNDVAKSIYPELENVGKLKFKDGEILAKLDKIQQNDHIFNNDQVYNFESKEIIKKGFRHDTLIGKNYTFVNVTNSYNYQKVLANDVDKATKKIKAIQQSVLVSFANLVEARDGYTGAHIKNVALYARLLAEELAKNPKYKNEITPMFIDVLENCAPLHDVGKIKIPDSILGKPGRLSPEEFEIMKTHTIEGGVIIDSVFKDIEEEHYVDMSKELVTCHHEWWNGKGYPYGLKGENIPLSARIMAIVDVYDALRMTRPYKQAFSKSKSIEIMKEEKGTHFDPELLDVFLELISGKNDL